MATHGAPDGQSEACPAALCELGWGATFAYRSTIARTPDGSHHYAEPSLSKPKRPLRCFLRTFRRDDATTVSWSDDDGLTWTEPSVTQIIGHPLDPVLLSDGRSCWCMDTVTHRMGARPAWDGTCEVLSGDEVVLRDDGRSVDLGYPWGVQLSDGRVLVAYYFHDEAGLRSEATLAELQLFQPVAIRSSGSLRSPVAER